MKPMRLAIIAGLLVSTLASAKAFKTKFISLQLPPNWDCRQEELDWVCQPDNLAERAEAIVVIVTKAANDVDDTFPKYEDTLKQSRPMHDLLGNAYQSQVKFVRTREIKAHKWVDALQLGSEVPGFYTRYVASIQEKVAGMVTYSVAESVYPKYAPVLDQMIDTLEIFFDPKAFEEALKSAPGSILTKAKAGGRGVPTLDDATKKKSEGGGMDMTQILGGLVVVGAVGYFVWKKKKGSAS